MENKVLINQLFDLKNKLKKAEALEPVERNINRMFNTFEQMGLEIHDPIGEKYNDSRTDCEAQIIGREAKEMIISSVIKPVIFQKENGAMTIIQKAIVTVEKK